MSLKDFWMNVRSGARLLAPGPVADSPRLDASDMERVLRGAAIWLTPETIEEFNPADFDFLSAEERQTLTDSVHHFREILRRLPPNQQVTAEQIQQALPYFLRILQILRPDRYADPEALRAGKRIEQQLADRLPPEVCELRFQTGDDVSGDPALWIWVVFKEEAAKDEKAFLQAAKVVRQLLEQTVRRLKLEHWPFVRFRTVSELEPPVRKANK